MKSVGYLPGEVALPDGLNGVQFLEMMKGLRGGRGERMQEMIDLFQVNLNGSVKKMSIGEKRKLAVVAAFMSDPDILLLDEPTSGLDPVMQEVFIDFVKSEKEKGKTVLLSSHIFSEVEALCDRIAIIKEGRIVSVTNAEEVKHFKRKTFDITFADRQNLEKFKQTGFEIKEEDSGAQMLSVAAENPQCDKLIKTLVQFDVVHFVEHNQTLEDYFMNFYKSDRTFGGIAHGKHH